MYILAFAVSGEPNRLPSDTLLTDLIQHVSIDFYRAVNAFVNYADVPHGALKFFGLLSDPTSIAKGAVYSTQNMLADSFFVRPVHLCHASFVYSDLVSRKFWRCYIVWGKHWLVIVLGVLMLLGELGALL